MPTPLSHITVDTQKIDQGAPSERALKLDASARVINALPFKGSRTSTSTPLNERKITPRYDVRAHFDAQASRLQPLLSASADELKHSPTEEAVLKRAATVYDVITLFIKLSQIAIKEREFERVARRTERDAQIEHMKLVVENFEQQANAMLQATVTAGVMGILGGGSVFLTYAGGDQLKDLLGLLYSPLGKMETPDLMKMVQTMLDQGSKMSAAQGEIKKTFYEGHRTWDQHRADLGRIEAEELSRLLGDNQQDLWQTLSFLTKTLEMAHQAAIASYR